LKESVADLAEYEVIVAELVAELQRYRSAASTLDTAFQTWAELRAHHEATGKEVGAVVAEAAAILRELRRLDAPELVANLERAFDAHQRALQQQSDRVIGELTSSIEARITEPILARLGRSARVLTVLVGVNLALTIVALIALLLR
jgi:hypothetical protein